jgi:hypothetical protein
MIALLLLLLQGDDLPKFTDAEKALLKANPIDIFSVNFYCGYYVWAPEAGAPKNQVRFRVHPLCSRMCGLKQVAWSEEDCAAALPAVDMPSACRCVQ